MTEQNNHKAHPTQSVNYEDVTHVDETRFSHTLTSPGDEDSEAASLSVNMDIASKRMVDDLVDSAVADDNDRKLSKSALEISSSEHLGDETSYGLIGSSTVRDFSILKDQPAVTPPPVLPSILNSPFAPQPGEASPITKTITPRHSRNNSQIVSPFQRPNEATITSSMSSMPEPTNPKSSKQRGFHNQPFFESRFPTRINYTTGANATAADSNNSYGTPDDCRFISPTIDWGCSGSIKGESNAQTPANGQGTG